MPDSEIQGNAFDENPFIAVHEAHKLADYFMLPGLTTGLVSSLAKRLQELTVTFQRNYKDRNGQDAKCQADFLLSLDDFFDSFFGGVHYVFAAQHNNKDLRAIFVDFGARSRIATLRNRKFVAGLRQETAFAAEVLIATNPGKNSMLYWCPRSQCLTCNTELFSDGVCIPRLGYSGDVADCSRCFKG